jgi:hypothetical protein
LYCVQLPDRQAVSTVIDGFLAIQVARLRFHPDVFGSLARRFTLRKFMLQNVRVYWEHRCFQSCWR